MSGFAETSASLPEFRKFLSAQSIKACLEGGEVNVEGFYSIWEALRDCLSLFKGELEQLAHHILPAVESDLDRRFQVGQLKQNLRYKLDSRESLDSLRWCKIISCKLASLLLQHLLSSMKSSS